MDNLERVMFGYRGVEQLVAHQAHNLGVTGSSPVSATRWERAAGEILG